MAHPRKAFERILRQARIKVEDVASGGERLKGDYYKWTKNVQEEEPDPRVMQRLAEDIAVDIYGVIQAVCGVMDSVARPWGAFSVGDKPEVAQIRRLTDKFLDEFEKDIKERYPLR